MRRARVLMAVALAAAGALVAAGSSALPAAAIGGAAAAPGEEAAFAQAVNRIRAGRGLQPLSLDGELSAIARSWSFTMAAAGEIAHRTDLGVGVTSEWLSLGENVGAGPTVDELMTAFVNSPGHFKNIVEARFTHIGIGAVIAGGLIFTTHEFMRLDGAAPVPVPVPPPIVRTQPTAPRPTATTALPRRAAPAPSVAAPAPPPPPPPPAPRPPPHRVIDVLDRLRGNPPAF